MVNLVGKTIDEGRFLVERRFGLGGGTSDIFVVRNARSKVCHLMKVNLSADELRQRMDLSEYIISKIDQGGHRQRTIDELEFTRKLHHPNIVEYLDIIPLPENRLGLLMNPMGGVLDLAYNDGEIVYPAKTVGEIITNLNEVDANLTVRLPLMTKLFLEMKNVLYYFSEKHMLPFQHRDIKPNNIIMDYTGKTWVIDFGCASHSSAPGVNHGSEYYCSPQVVSRFVIPDNALDVWSLGVTCLELLLGHHPLAAGKRTQEHRDRYVDYLKNNREEDIQKALDKVYAGLLERFEEEKRKYPEAEPYEPYLIAIKPAFDVCSAKRHDWLKSVNNKPKRDSVFEFALKCAFLPE